jgi:hypothetical protein
MHYRTSLHHCFNIVAFPRNGNTQTILLYRDKAEQNKVIQKDIDPLASYHVWEKYLKRLQQKE